MIAPCPVSGPNFESCPVPPSLHIGWDRPSTCDLGCTENVALRMAIHRAIPSLVSLYDGSRSSTAPKRMSEVPGLLDLTHLLGSLKHIQLGLSGGWLPSDGHTSVSASPCLILRTRNYAVIAPCPDVLPEFPRFPGPTELGHRLGTPKHL